MIEAAVPVRNVSHRPVVVSPDQGKGQQGARTVSQVGIRPGSCRIKGIGQVAPPLFGVVDFPPFFRNGSKQLEVAYQALVKAQTGTVVLSDTFQNVGHQCQGWYHQRVRQFPLVRSGTVVHQSVIVQQTDAVSGVLSDGLPVDQYVIPLYRHARGIGQQGLVKGFFQGFPCLRVSLRAIDLREAVGPSHPPYQVADLDPFVVQGLEGRIFLLRSVLEFQGKRPIARESLKTPVAGCYLPDEPGHLFIRQPFAAVQPAL